MNITFMFQFNFRYQNGWKPVSPLAKEFSMNILMIILLLQLEIAIAWLNFSPQEMFYTQNFAVDKPAEGHTAYFVMQ